MYSTFHKLSSLQHVYNNLINGYTFAISFSSEISPTILEVFTSNTDKGIDSSLSFFDE